MKKGRREEEYGRLEEVKWGMAPLEGRGGGGGGGGEPSGELKGGFCFISHLILRYKQLDIIQHCYPEISLRG